jgi:hypothetical protein
MHVHVRLIEKNIIEHYLETLPVTPHNIIFLVLISSSNSKHDFIDETDKKTTLVDILLRKRRYKLTHAESNNLHIKFSFV